MFKKKRQKYRKHIEYREWISKTGAKCYNLKNVMLIYSRKRIHARKSLTWSSSAVPSNHRKRNSGITEICFKISNVFRVYFEWLTPQQIYNAHFLIFNDLSKKRNLIYAKHKLFSLYWFSFALLNQALFVLNFRYTQSPQWT